MVENLSELNTSSQRAIKRAEVLSKRVDVAKSNAGVPIPAGSSWLEVVNQAKNLRSIDRLGAQIEKFTLSAPDLSEDLNSLGIAVAGSTRLDDRGELDKSFWGYAALLGEYRTLKSYEATKHDLASTIAQLRQDRVRLDPSTIVYVNPETQQAMIGGGIVTFTNQRDWAVFMHFVDNRNKAVFPRDISSVARENGATDANASSSSVTRLRKLIEKDPSDPQLIVTEGNRRNARYKLLPSEARFFYPSAESHLIDPEGVRLSHSKVLKLDDYREERDKEFGKRRQELIRRDPELPQRIRDIMDEINEAPEFGGNKLASLDQISRAFPTLKIDYMADLREKYISPQQREGDHHHPGFEKDEIAFMVYFKRHGERLSLTPVLVKELLQIIREKASENESSSKNSQ